MLRWLCLKAAAAVDVGRDASAEVLRAPPERGTGTGGWHDSGSGGPPSQSLAARGNTVSAPHCEKSDVTSPSSPQGKCIPFLIVLQARAILR
jgi:hypothetical protein